MKINLITGASGFVGRHLVERLLKKGENVWVVMRSLEGVSVKERSEKLFFAYLEKYPDNFRVIEGDITKEGLGISLSCIKELEQADVFLWHLAASLSFSNKNKENILRTNCVGTTNVVDLANRIAEKYVHMSTSYVCGDSELVFKETDLDIGQKFRNYYESSKFEAEKHVRKNCKRPYLVFRPSIIMGDAYEGKAEGCTFGYYRFAYMFFIFKSWLVEKILEGSFFTKKMLLLLGSRYNKEDDTLTVPWLVLPYPTGGTVDMVPVDYVISSMLDSVNRESFYNQTIHLTNPNPPAFKLVLESVISDLGYRKVKYIKIHPFLFKGILKTLHYTFFPLRVKTRSAMWYLPYITRKYSFSHENNRKVGLSEPELITRGFLKKVNIYAQKEIFSNTSLSRKL